MLEGTLLLLAIGGVVVYRWFRRLLRGAPVRVAEVPEPTSGGYP